MLTQEVEVAENVGELVEKLNFAEKVEHSLELFYIVYKAFGDSLVVANSLGKDSSAVWHLAKRISHRFAALSLRQDLNRQKPSSS